MGLKWIAVLPVVIALCFSALPVAAVPYTQTELEEYMEAIYCEQVWAQAFSEYQVQFVDVDLDGRMELITMEAGEAYAPKKAEVYAFMDAEFSGRGKITVGKLETCRDPETDESFMVSRVEKDGQIFCQRLVYDHEGELISLHDLTDECAARLEDYGYSPVVVTNADYEAIKVYEDCRAIFLPAYQNTIYTNGEPPITESQDAGTAQTQSIWGVPLFWVALAVAAMILVAAAWAMVRRRRDGTVK